MLPQLHCSHISSAICSTKYTLQSQRIKPTRRSRNSEKHYPPTTVISKVFCSRFNIGVQTPCTLTQSPRTASPPNLTIFLPLVFLSMSNTSNIRFWSVFLTHT